MNAHPRPVRISVIVALALSAVAVSGQSARGADAGGPPALPACVGVRTDARYVPYGYNHVVIVTNGCARPASCTITTDVNPEPQKATVAPSSTVEVTTFMGSPSAVFTAKVACSLR